MGSDGEVARSEASEELRCQLILAEGAASADCFSPPRNEVMEKDALGRLHAELQAQRSEIAEQHLELRAQRNQIEEQTLQLKEASERRRLDVDLQREQLETELEAE